MADYNINAITRRVVYTGSAGLGPYAFSFEIIDQADVGVYFNQTLLTLSSDYTVTINANGTGSVNIITGGNVPSTPTATDTVIIIGTRDIERTTDFVTAGDLLASSLNEQLDSNIIFEQQIDERVDRSIKFPVYDSFTGDNVLPAAAARADKILKFDTDGNVAVESASALVGGAVVGANFTNNTFTGDGSQTAFTTTVEAGSKNNAQVYIDGVYQLKSSFSVSGTTLTFTEAPPLNSQIEVIIGNAIDTLDADSGNINYNQGGTGAQTRTVESKLKERISAADFGTGIDSVIKAAAAIQANGGGVLELAPNEIYEINWQTYTSPVIHFESIQGLKIVGNGATFKGVDNGGALATPSGARYIMSFKNGVGLSFENLKFDGTYNTFTTDPDHTNTRGEFGIHLWTGTINVDIKNIIAIKLNTFFDVSDFVTAARETSRVRNINIDNVYLLSCRYGFLYLFSGDNVSVKNVKAYNSARTYYIACVDNHDVQIYSEPAHTFSDILISCQTDSAYTRKENTISNIKLDYTSPNRYTGYTLPLQNTYDALCTIQANIVSATTSPAYINNLDLKFNVGASAESASVCNIGKYYYDGSDSVPDDTGTTRNHQIENITISGKVKDWANATNASVIPFRVLGNWNSMDWSGDTVTNIKFKDLVTENDPTTVMLLNDDGASSSQVRFSFDNCSFDGNVDRTNATNTEPSYFATSINSKRMDSQVAAWAQVNGATGNLISGFNVASSQRNSTGDYTVTWDIDMASGDYAVSGMTVKDGAVSTVIERRTNIALAATSARFSTRDSTTGTLVDCTEFYVVVFGDKS